MSNIHHQWDSDINDQCDSDIDNERDSYIDNREFECDEYGHVDCADGSDYILHDSDSDISSVEASSQDEEDASNPVIPLPENESLINQVSPTKLA